MSPSHRKQREKTHTRLTITVPIRLLEDLKPHRKDLNVSAICSAAIRREVENRRVIQEHKVGLQEAVARLRAERLESDDRSRKEGYETGAAWVLKSASYEEIKWLTGEVAPRVEGGESAKDIVGNERQEVYDLMPPLASLAQLIDPDTFWKGFLQAVLDIWAQIKDAVEGDEAPPPRSDDR